MANTDEGSRRTDVAMAEEMSRTQQPALPKTCYHPLCGEQAELGSDYCTRHGPPDFSPGISDLSDLDVVDTSPDLPAVSDPSRDSQLDRIEEKLDRLLTLLDDSEE